MKNRQSIIGYNRRVDYDWLQHTAKLAVEAHSAKEIKAELSLYLADKLSRESSAARGSREKTITVLMKTWVTVTPAIQAFRDRGLELLRVFPVTEHVEIHWGMTMAAYPFWARVAETTGRLLRLQEAVAASQIQRRVKELYGDRETAYRSARYVLQAFRDWGALESLGRTGEYKTAPCRVLSNPQLIAWLLEALFHSDGADLQQYDSLITSPALFPFELKKVRPEELAAHGVQIDHSRQGIDSYLLVPEPGSNSSINNIQRIR